MYKLLVLDKNTWNHNCVYIISISSYLKLWMFIMILTLQSIMNSSYYYEYQENIHLGVKLTPA